MCNERSDTKDNRYTNGLFKKNTRRHVVLRIKREYPSMNPNYLNNAKDTLNQKSTLNFLQLLNF